MANPVQVQAETGKASPPAGAFARRSPIRRP